MPETTPASGPPRIRRELVVPVAPADLWRALTDPGALAGWFGAEVEWDLAAGGGARFVDGAGAVREGVVDTAVPERELRFRWWPEGGAADGTSEVTYQLEPDPGGTRLTVTERAIAPAAPAARATARVLARA
jgi:uncharacterized protein YndB with AHSA1/START domain